MKLGARWGVVHPAEKVTFLQDEPIMHEDIPTRKVQAQQEMK